MRFILICLFALFISTSVFPQTEAGLDDAIVNERTETISKTLRCVVCQNQSIADSNSTLAEDMRGLVERRVRLGDTDQEVRDYMKARYGDFVLMAPPMQANTYILWFTPLILAVIGLIWYLLVARRQTPEVLSSVDDGLSKADEIRLQELLRGDENKKDET